MPYTAHNLQDTIVALSTPPGSGAIGVIRLSGKEAIDIVGGVFIGKDLKQQPTHTLHFGTIRDGDGEVIDEVVVGLFVEPKSYTGEDVVEVSCHGSSYIIQELIQLFIKKGARLAQPGEFTMRAFLHGRLDLSQAEAVADLIAAESKVQHDLALRQMRGGFSGEIQKLRQQLIDFASLIELELDFAEEDVEFADRDELRSLIDKARALLQSLIQSFQLGNVIKRGVSTVLAGRPNAGKSTLLNALLNEERALVSDIAGTTRDTIEEVLNINGMPFRLIDTAGIRDAEDTIEAMGVERTIEKVQQSAVLIYIFDVVETQPEEVRADLEKLVHPGLEVIVVANKMDLNPYTKFEHYFPAPEEEGDPDFTEAASEEGAKSEPDFAEATSGGAANSESQRSEDPDSEAYRDSESKRSEDPDSEAYRDSESKRSEDPDSDSVSGQPRLRQGYGGQGITKSQWVPISAINQMNLAYLKEKLYDAVLAKGLNLDNPIVTNARHVEALQHADDHLAAALRGIDGEVTMDFVAMDIRQALHQLGEITGEISTDDLLGNIFSNFCIGK